MKIICIGRNYIEHAAEMNNPIPDKPVFFMKPETALVPKSFPFFYPDFSNEVHYELELVLRICKVGKNIQEKFAHTYFDQISLGIDFTARDIQHQCTREGLPWEICKAFDGSAPVGRFIPKEDLGNLHDLDFRLELNGATVQKSNSGKMIFNFDKIISYVSSFVTLKIGDLIFTGTPAGVGPVKKDDILDCWLKDEKLLSIEVK